MAMKAKPNESLPEDEDEYNLTDEKDKAMYKIIFGKDWDEEFPPEKPSKG